MLATGLLTSCGIYKKYQPVEEVQSDIYGAANVTSDTTSLGNLPWREVFTDPQLQSLIEEGLSQNTDLLSAQQRIKESEATLKAAKLAFLPSFALAPTGTISSFDNQKATKTYTLPLTASWEVDIFGKILNAKRQSQSLYEQSKDYEQAVKTQLVANIANCYYTLLMLDRQLEIAQETEESWLNTLTKTRALMEAGMTTDAAVAQIEAAYYSVRTTSADLKEQINQTENSLCLLLGEAPHKIGRSTLDAQQLPESLACGVPVQMLSNRPDVRSAERSMEQAYYSVNQAKAAFYPSLNLSGTLGWTNNAGVAVINPGKMIATAVGSLTQPLFSNGKLTAQLKIAKAQQEEARLSFQQTLLNAGVEVNNAISSYQTAKLKTDDYAKQVEALDRAVTKTELYVDNSTTTYLEVLTAKQSLLNAELTQVANQFTEMQSVVNLYQALGGGRY